MAGKMVVHAFGVGAKQNSASLDELLEGITQTDLKDRVRNVGSQFVRIEDITYKSGMWFVDFGKFRDQHGPGKASRDKPVEGFQFDKGELFCEETACLYIPESKHLIVQYNNSGAKTGAIQEYLNSFDRERGYCFEIKPVFDQMVEQKYKKRYSTRKLIFKVDVRSFTKSDKYHGTALYSALDIGEKADGETVEISISAGRGKRSYLTAAANWVVDYLRERMGEDPESVPKLKVGITEDIDGKLQMLDLVAHRLKTEFDKVQVGADLRMPRDERYGYLLRAYNGWKGALR